MAKVFVCRYALWAMVAVVVLFGASQGYAAEPTPEKTAVTKPVTDPSEELTEAKKKELTEKIRGERLRDAIKKGSLSLHQAQHYKVIKEQ